MGRRGVKNEAELQTLMTLAKLTPNLVFSDEITQYCVSKVSAFRLLLLVLFLSEVAERTEMVT